jgi:hypothetical protein
MAESNRRPVSAPLDTQALPMPRNKARDFEGWAEVYTDHEVRHIIAPYAARIAHLERELAERKPVSIDSNQFRDLLAKYASSTFCGFGEAEAKAALIAYIDGRTQA